MVFFGTFSSIVFPLFCVRARLHTLFARAVSVSVAFPISLPVFSFSLPLSVCSLVSFICRQPTNNEHTHQHPWCWQRKMATFISIICFCCPFFSAMHASLSHCIIFFSFTSYPILRIKPSSSPLHHYQYPQHRCHHRCCHCPIARLPTSLSNKKEWNDTNTKFSIE